MTGRILPTRTLRGRSPCLAAAGHRVHQRAVAGPSVRRIDAAAGRPRASPRRRWLRSDHVLGRWAGRDRLARGTGQARPGNRGVPGRRRPCPCRRRTGSARARIRNSRGAGSRATPSASTACRSCCSRRCWTWTRITPTPISAPSRESGSGRRRCLVGGRVPRPEWTLDHIGLDRRSGRLRKGGAAPGSAAPGQPALRLRLREPAAHSAAIGSADGGARDAAARTTCLQEHVTARGQDARHQSRGELGTGSARIRQSGHDRPRVAVVRRMPRRTRAGVGQDALPARHAQHGNRGAVLLQAADADGRRAGGVRLRSRVHRAGEPGEHHAAHAR